MWIFTTREIAIFIYAILLLVYVFARKKGKNILLPVLKAACHIKLIVPFLFVLSFAAIFVWLCTYLPFWDWAYLKDIIFWTLFAGVPVCFNATSRKLEDHYFRNILIDNFQFAALAEFITGTFTFPIVVELILQPILVIFVVLQSTAEKTQDNKVKKFIDVIVAIAGFVILALTVKSIIDAIGNIAFLDIAVSFVLPIILSVLYLPVAYCFAVYAKYELLFLRMNFKEPKDKKVKIAHRIKLICLCKLSYTKVCKFLYEYLPKMYVGMSNLEFDSMIDNFRGTTEHTYIAAIKHNGQYYVSRQLLAGSKFAFNSYTVNKGGLFKSSNKTLRKEIALQIQNETSFRNTDYNDESIHVPVSLRKIFLFNKGAFFKRTKIAVFLSNELEDGSESVDLPYGRYIKNQSDGNTIRLMRALKWDAYWAPFLAVLIYFILFFLSSLVPNEWGINLDLVAFIFAIISQLRGIFSGKSLLSKSRFGRKLLPLQRILTSCGIFELLIFLMSFCVAYALQPSSISSVTLSKLGIAFIFSGVLIDICKRDQ